ncbi:hypothetical protein DIPPA_35398 [Diplonema papillatum]|nr:hypothetical protein DIPPA_35398 [Diplonema papillatum]
MFREALRCPAGDVLHLWTELLLPRDGRPRPASRGPLPGRLVGQKTWANGAGGKRGIPPAEERRQSTHPPRVSSRPSAGHRANSTGRSCRLRQRQRGSVEYRQIPGKQPGGDRTAPLAASAAPENRRQKSVVPPLDEAASGEPSRVDLSQRERMPTVPWVPPCGRPTAQRAASRGRRLAPDGGGGARPRGKNCRLKAGAARAPGIQKEKQGSLKGRTGDGDVPRGTEPGVDAAVAPASRGFGGGEEEKRATCQGGSGSKGPAGGGGLGCTAPGGNATVAPASRGFGGGEEEKRATRQGGSGSNLLKGPAGGGGLGCTAPGGNATVAPASRGFGGGEEEKRATRQGGSGSNLLKGPAGGDGLGCTAPGGNATVAPLLQGLGGETRRDDSGNNLLKKASDLSRTEPKVAAIGAPPSQGLGGKGKERATRQDDSGNNLLKGSSDLGRTEPEVDATVAPPSQGLGEKGKERATRQDGSGNSLQKGSSDLGRIEPKVDATPPLHCFGGKGKERAPRQNHAGSSLLEGPPTSVLPHRQDLAGTTRGRSRASIAKRYEREAVRPPPGRLSGSARQWSFDDAAGAAAVAAAPPAFSGYAALRQAACTSLAAGLVVAAAAVEAGPKRPGDYWPTMRVGVALKGTQSLLFTLEAGVRVTLLDVRKRLEAADGGVLKERRWRFVGKPYAKLLDKLEVDCEALRVGLANDEDMLAKAWERFAAYDDGDCQVYGTLLKRRENVQRGRIRYETLSESLFELRAVVEGTPLLHVFPLLPKPGCLPAFHPRPFSPIYIPAHLYTPAPANRAHQFTQLATLVSPFAARMAQEDAAPDADGPLLTPRAPTTTRWKPCPRGPSRQRGGPARGKLRRRAAAKRPGGGATARTPLTGRWVVPVVWVEFVDAGGLPDIEDSEVCATARAYCAAAPPPPPTSRKEAAPAAGGEDDDDDDEEEDDSGDEESKDRGEEREELARDDRSSASSEVMSPRNGMAMHFSLRDAGSPRAAKEKPSFSKWLGDVEGPKLRQLLALPDEFVGFSCVHLAVATRNLPALAVLGGALGPAGLYQRDSSGQTAMHIAVRNNDAAAAALLFRIEATLSARPRTPPPRRSVARDFVSGRRSIASRLHQLGLAPHPEPVSPAARRADFWASISPRSLRGLSRASAVSIVEEEGPFAEAVDRAGRTPLALAVDLRRTELAALLAAACSFSGPPGGWSATSVGGGFPGAFASGSSSGGLEPAPGGGGFPGFFASSSSGCLQPRPDGGLVPVPGGGGFPGLFASGGSGCLRQRHGGGLEPAPRGGGFLGFFASSGSSGRLQPRPGGGLAPAPGGTFSGVDGKPSFFASGSTTGCLRQPPSGGLAPAPGGGPAGGASPSFFASGSSGCLLPRPGGGLEPAPGGGALSGVHRKPAASPTFVASDSSGCLLPRPGGGLERALQTAPPGVLASRGGSLPGGGGEEALFAECPPSSRRQPLADRRQGRAAGAPPQPPLPPVEGAPRCLPGLDKPVPPFRLAGLSTLFLFTPAAVPGNDPYAPQPEDPGSALALSSGPRGPPAFSQLYCVGNQTSNTEQDDTAGRPGAGGGCGLPESQNTRAAAGSFSQQVRGVCGGVLGALRALLSPLGAVCAGDAGRVEFLYRHGLWERGGRDLFSGRSLLQWAVACGGERMCRLLLSFGEDAGWVNDAVGWNAVHEAAWVGARPVMEAVLEAGGGLLGVRTRENGRLPGMTPLQVNLSRMGCGGAAADDLCAKLITRMHIDDILSVDGRSRSALHTASAAGRDKPLGLLLECILYLSSPSTLSATVNAVDADSDTPWSLALKANSPPCLTALLETGVVDLSLPLSFNRHILLIAAEARSAWIEPGRHRDTHGDPSPASKSQGDTPPDPPPCTKACADGASAEARTPTRLEKSVRLAVSPADVPQSSCDTGGRQDEGSAKKLASAPVKSCLRLTPLQAPEGDGEAEWAEASRDDASSPDSDGRAGEEDRENTRKMTRELLEREGVVMVLLRRLGVDGVRAVSGLEGKRTTALHVAVSAGDFGLASELLSRGGEPDACYDGSTTPLQTACANADLPMVRLLLANCREPFGSVSPLLPLVGLPLGLRLRAISAAKVSTHPNLLTLSASTAFLSVTTAHHYTTTQRHLTNSDNTALTLPLTTETSTSVLLSILNHWPSCTCFPGHEAKDAKRSDDKASSALPRLGAEENVPGVQQRVGGRGSEPCARCDAATVAGMGETARRCYLSGARRNGGKPLASLVAYRELWALLSEAADDPLCGWQWQLVATPSQRTVLHWICMLGPSSLVPPVAKVCASLPLQTDLHGMSPMGYALQRPSINHVIALLTLTGEASSRPLVPSSVRILPFIRLKEEPLRAAVPAAHEDAPDDDFPHCAQALESAQALDQILADAIHFSAYRSTEDYLLTELAQETNRKRRPAGQRDNAAPGPDACAPVPSVRGLLGAGAAPGERRGLNVGYVAAGGVLTLFSREPGQFSPSGGQIGLCRTVRTAMRRGLEARYALHWAVQCNAVVLLRLLLRARGDADYVNCRVAGAAGGTPASDVALGATALHLACLLGRRLCVELLLASPFCDPNAAGSSGETPLAASLRAGCTSIARVLLKHGAAPNTCTESPAALPCRVRSTPSFAESTVFRRLARASSSFPRPARTAPSRSHTPHTFTTAQVSRVTPLLLLARNAWRASDLPTVRSFVQESFMLLELPGNPVTLHVAHGSIPVSPLAVALAGLPSELPSSDFLIELTGILGETRAGVNALGLDRTDEEGRSAVELAACWDRVDFAVYLAELCPRAAVCALRHGRGIIHLFARKRSLDGVLWCLRAAETNPPAPVVFPADSTAASSERNPSDVFCQPQDFLEGSTSSVLASRADDFHRTPLHYAAQATSKPASSRWKDTASPEYGILDALLRAGSPVDAIDFLGRSPLLVAVRGNAPGVALELLLQYASVACVNLCDYRGCNVLHYAGSPSVAALLVASGALVQERPSPLISQICSNREDVALALLPHAKQLFRARGGSPAGGGGAPRREEADGEANRGLASSGGPEPEGKQRREEADGEAYRGLASSGGPEPEGKQRREEAHRGLASSGGPEPEGKQRREEAHRGLASSGGPEPEGKQRREQAHRGLAASGGPKPEGQQATAVAGSAADLPAQPSPAASGSSDWRYDEARDDAFECWSKPEESSNRHCDGVTGALSAEKRVAGVIQLRKSTVVEEHPHPLHTAAASGSSGRRDDEARDDAFECWIKPEERMQAGSNRHCGGVTGVSSAGNGVIQLRRSAVVEDHPLHMAAAKNMLRLFAQLAAAVGDFDTLASPGDPHAADASWGGLNSLSYRLLFGGMQPIAEGVGLLLWTRGPSRRHPSVAAVLARSATADLSSSYTAGIGHPTRSRATQQQPVNQEEEGVVPGYSRTEKNPLPGVLQRYDGDVLARSAAAFYAYGTRGRAFLSRGIPRLNPSVQEQLQGALGAGDDAAAAAAVALARHDDRRVRLEGLPSFQRLAKYLFQIEQSVAAVELRPPVPPSYADVSARLKASLFAALRTTAFTDLPSQVPAAERERFTAPGKRHAACPAPGFFKPPVLPEKVRGLRLGEKAKRADLNFEDASLWMRYHVGFGSVPWPADEAARDAWVLSVARQVECEERAAWDAQPWDRTLLVNTRGREERDRWLAAGAVTFQKVFRAAVRPVEREGPDYRASMKPGTSSIFHQCALKGLNLTMKTVFAINSADDEALDAAVASALNYRDEHGYAPLHYAVSTSRFETVNLILRNGGSWHVRDVVGGVPASSFVPSFSAYLTLAALKDPNLPYSAFPAVPQASSRRVVRRLFRPQFLAAAAAADPSDAPSCLLWPAAPAVPAAAAAARLTLEDVRALHVFSRCKSLRGSNSLLQLSDAAVDAAREKQISHLRYGAFFFF